MTKCEEDWKALLGDQSEEAYIAALGLVVVSNG